MELRPDAVETRFTPSFRHAVPYGIPLDSRSQRTKTDFALWMAGVYDSNSTLRDAFINGVVDFLAYGETGVYSSGWAEVLHVVLSRTDTFKRCYCRASCTRLV